MKIVSIITHPMKQSLIYRLWEHATQLLEKKGYDVTRVDLYSLHYSPLLKPADPAGIKTVEKQVFETDIDALFKNIENSEALLFAYPGWWNNMPGILKTFFDRVPFRTTPFGFPEKSWKNKKAVIISGGGAPFFVRKFIMKNRLITNVTYVLKNLGVSIRGVLISDGIPKASEKKIASWFEKTEIIINKLN
jgi:putative NADPH-quinone reductase